MKDKNSRISEHQNNKKFMVDFLDNKDSKDQLNNGQFLNQTLFFFPFSY